MGVWGTPRSGGKSKLSILTRVFLFSNQDSFRSRSREETIF
jgi:hypothetical protein